MHPWIPRPPHDQYIRYEHIKFTKEGLRALYTFLQKHVRRDLRHGMFEYPAWAAIQDSLRNHDNSARYVLASHYCGDGLSHTFYPAKNHYTVLSASQVDAGF